MSTAVRFGWIVLASSLPLVLGCSSKVDRRSILADDVLAALHGRDDAETATSVADANNWIELLLIENKYLFRPPALEPRQDTVDAVKGFQKDKAFPVTGRIDKAELQLLEKGAVDISGDIDLPGHPLFYVSSPLPGHRRASISRGTWSSKLPTTEDFAGWPNVAEIKCDESTHRCIESDATIIGTESGPGTLMADTNVWEIQVWAGRVGDGGRMLATGVGSACPSLQVDWDAKTARSTSCETPEGQQETSELIDGFRPYFDFLNAKRKARFAVWNSKYTRLQEGVIKSQPH